jgi:hypothetical protein
MICEDIDYSWIYQGEDRELDDQGNPILEPWEDYCWECGRIAIPEKKGEPFMCNICKREW